MAGRITVDISLHLRWWLRPAVAVLTGLARLHPHHALGDVLLFVVRHGVRTKVSRAR